MTDPKGWIQSPPNTFVKVVNTSRETMNGRFGLCLQYHGEKSRYMILLVPTGNDAGSNQEQQVLLKTENLIECTFVEKFQAQYNLLRYNPEVQRTVRNYYDQIQTKTGIKPEYFGLGFLLVFAVLVYLIGFSKVMLLLSFGVLVFTIIAPDLQLGYSSQQIIKNMPMRWKNLLREHIPYGYGPKIVDNQVAFYAVTAFILFIFIKPLLTFPTKVAKAAAAATAVSSAGVSGNTVAGLPTSALTLEHVNQVYKLGYDDAIESKEFGTSLPQTMDKVRDLLGIAATISNDVLIKPPKVMGAVDDSDVDDSYSWQSTPTASTPSNKNSWSSLLNFANLFGIFTLYRILEPISKNADGKFDYELLIANIKTLDVWKLGLIGFSIYRMFSQFM